MYPKGFLSLSWRLVAYFGSHYNVFQTLHLVLKRVLLAATICVQTREWRSLLSVVSRQSHHYYIWMMTLGQRTGTASLFKNYLFLKLCKQQQDFIDSHERSRDNQFLQFASGWSEATGQSLEVCWCFKNSGAKYYSNTSGIQ